MEDNKLLYGKVVFFSNKIGFGFLTPDNGGKDYFIHWSNINMQGYKSLQKDQEVSFEEGLNRKGQIQAINVTPIISSRS